MRQSHATDAHLHEQTLTAIFDGQMLRPDTPLDLEPDKRYVLIVEEAKGVETAGDAWAVLDTLTGSVEAPQDWSGEHAHYLYGTAKRSGTLPDP